MSRFPIDSTVKSLLQIVAAGTLLIVGLITIFLSVESWPAITKLGWRMVSDVSWYPTLEENPTFGMLPIVVGTFLVTFGAIVVAAPIGVISAIFNQYYAPANVSFFYRRLIELLVGIPSVVFGFWGLVVLVPRLTQVIDSCGFGPVPGPSLLAAILIVSLMILPTVMLIAEEAMKSVRPEYISAAVALGMGRLSIIKHIVLPQSKIGITTGIVLAIARAIGETMAVVMVAGNIVQIPGSIFDPVRTLTANIAMEMDPAVGLHQSALYFSGLLLLISVAVLFVFEIFLRRAIWRSA